MRESSGHKLSCLKNLSWALLFSATLKSHGRAGRGDFNLRMGEHVV
jgi:hypothetical protein